MFASVYAIVRNALKNLMSRNHYVSKASLALFVCVGTANAGLLSGPVINPSNGHTYYLLTNQNWTDSEAEAVTLGGHLVTVNDAAENTWVVDTFGNFDGSRRHLWIGFSDQTVEGDFVWASGELATYTNWSAGNPDNTNDEDYTYMIPDTGLWNDGQNGLFGGGPSPQGTSIFGVVEINSTIPEPSTAVLAALGGLMVIGRRRRAYARDCRPAVVDVPRIAMQ